MAECNIDKSCFDDVKVCVKVNSVNGIKPNADGEVDIDESFVTTNTPQTIIGTKDFANTIKTNGMNHEAMLTTMNGLKIDTAPTVINKSSITWNDKEQNEVSSIEVSRPANTKDTCISLSANTITEWGSNEKASIDIHAKAGSTSYATAPTPSSNATGNEIVTAKWVIDKGLADDSNVVHKTGTESINGAKHFNDSVYMCGMLCKKNTSADLTVTPTNGAYTQYLFIDKNNTILGYVEHAQRNTGVNDVGLWVKDKNANMHGIQVTANNELLPATNNTYSLGSSAKKWGKVYSDDVVHTSGTETIEGTKKFTSDLVRKYTAVDITTTPTSDMYAHINFTDKNDKSVAYIQYAQRSNGVDYIGLRVRDKNSNTWGVQLNTNKEFIPLGNNTYNLGSPNNKWANVYSDEINTNIIGTKYIQHYDGGFLSTLTLPEHSGKVALQERTRANAEPVNRTLLYECAGGLDKGDITLGNMYTKYNALVIVYSNDDGGAISTYYLDCAELDIRREVAGSGTFLLVDGHSYWACTGASTGTKFVHADNNGLRIHKIYGLAEFY